MQRHYTELGVPVCAQVGATIDFLAGRGVESRAYFCPPVHEQEFFRKYADRALPRTEQLARRVITLPFFTSITPAEIDYVVEQLAEAGRRFIQ